MAGFATRWPTLISSTVAAADLDDDRCLTADAVERLVGEARSAYLDECRTFGGGSAVPGPVAIRRGGPLVGTVVTISIGVVEIYPDRFEMDARIRSDVDGEVLAEARGAVTVAGGVTDAIRDELIDRAHRAARMH